MTRYFSLAVMIALISIISIGCSGSDPVGSNSQSADLGLSPMTWAALGDYVWHDINRDGIQDAGEPGIPGVTVHLYDCADNHLDVMITDADGLYLFDGLWPGDFYIKFDRPAGYVFSPQDQGTDDAVDSDADPLTGKTACTNLTDYEEDLTWDAGLYVDDPPQDGCTRTIGYWKNWSGFGPQPDVVTALLPITLGSGGGKSLVVSTAAIAVDVLEMKTYGKNNNGITKLYAQLLGAKLSIASGADDADVAAEIVDADAFLHDYDWNDWKNLSEADADMVMDWQGMFDDYNNGDIGPGHCDDIDIEVDYDGIGGLGVK